MADIISRFALQDDGVGRQIAMQITAISECLEAGVSFARIASVGVSALAHTAEQVGQREQLAELLTAWARALRGGEPILQRQEAGHA